MKKKLFFLGLAIAFYFSLFTFNCNAQGDTAWIHNFTQENSIECVRISPDGQYIAAGFESGTISLFSVDSGNFIRSFTTTLEYPSICFSPDGQWLAGGGNDSLIYIWDVASGTITKTYSLSPEAATFTVNAISKIDISSNGNYLIAAFISSKDYRDPFTVKIWNLQNDSILFDTLGNQVYDVKFSTNNNYFVTENSYQDKYYTWYDMLIWSMDSLKVIAEFGNLPWWITDFAWSYTGDTLAIAPSDTLIYFIDVPQNRFVDTLHLVYGDYPVSSLRYFNNYIITGGGDWQNKHLSIYNMNNKSKIKTYGFEALDFDIDSTGTYIVVAGTSSNNRYLIMLHNNDFFSSVFEIPEDNNNYFRLYPNPTRDMANLEYDSDKADYINLGIYDFMGNIKEAIYSGFLGEGEHKFSWYPNNCQSGTYFCRIDNGKRVRVIKLIYIK
jgi:WD40 repeat protein